MTEHDADRERRMPVSGHPEGEISRDFAALTAVTERQLPTVHETIRAARLRAAVREGGGFPMAVFRVLKLRPRAASAAAVVLLGLLVVPISYEKTVGHHVRLAVPGAGLNRTSIDALAAELRAQLGAAPVAVRATDEGCELVAEVPSRDGRRAQAIVAAFERALRKAGYETVSEVTPVRERVSGSVYAAAADIIRVSTDGRSDAEIEAEVRNALAAAGFPEAEVRVQQDGDKTELEITSERTGDAATETEPMPEVILTKGGQDPTGEEMQRLRVKVQNVQPETGAPHVVVEVELGDRSATADVEHPAAMGDPALAAEIESQLARRGLNVRVEVVGGKVRVEPR